jgi:hypothetical protein
MVFIKSCAGIGGSIGRMEGRICYQPPAHSNKNHKKCDELAKKRDELVTGRFFGRKKGAGEVCSHGGTKPRRKGGVRE